MCEVIGPRAFASPFRVVHGSFGSVGDAAVRSLRLLAWFMVGAVENQVAIAPRFNLARLVGRLVGEVG